MESIGFDLLCRVVTAASLQSERDYELTRSRSGGMNPANLHAVGKVLRKLSLKIIDTAAQANELHQPLAMPTELEEVR